MASGSCLCGKIRYEAQTVGPDITKCHCKICQKLSGSAYGDYTTAPIDQFKWVQGQEELVEFESSPGAFRNFCRHCGTHMPTMHSSMGIAFIQPGTLDTEEELKETRHMFTRSKAPWHQMQVGLQEFAEYPAQ